MDIHRSSSHSHNNCYSNKTKMHTLTWLTCAHRSKVINATMWLLIVIETYLSILHCNVANLRICTPSGTIWHFDCTDNSWQKSTYILATMWDCCCIVPHLRHIAILRKHGLWEDASYSSGDMISLSKSIFVIYVHVVLIFHLFVSFRPNESVKECMMKWSHFGT